MKKYQCPCCGNYTLHEKPPGTYEICEVCNWEDDEIQFMDPTYSGGANLLCLQDARKRQMMKSMDNIIFEKVYQDGNLIELKISASSQYISAFQLCYIEDKKILDAAQKIESYIKNFDSEYYLEFGEKEGMYTPAFSMLVLPADSCGHVKIEVDMEIDDNDARLHRCCFFVESELGLVEQMGTSFKKLLSEPVGIIVALVPGCHQL